jgi:hypothetical protein
MYEKNNEVGVKNIDSGKVIQSKVIDVEYPRVWVRLPTQSVIEFKLHEKTGKYLGKMAGLELTLV